MASQTKVGMKFDSMVVVMLENRSLDNLCGWLYQNQQPNLVLPAGSPAAYNGLNTDLWNPANASYFQGAPPEKIPVKQGAKDTTVPNPDPEETFDNVTFQLYGPQGFSAQPQWPTLGFLVNYEKATSSSADQIMQAFTPTQLPVLSGLALAYGISDAWFCSMPSQTWPNRAFAHAGTSNGHVNNGAIPDPFVWNMTTIFDVLSSSNISWAVYGDTDFPGLESLTGAIFPHLVFDHFGNFHTIGDFETACAKSQLPTYSFLEPNFGVFSHSSENDYHPPSNVTPGEQFLYRIWKAISTSPAFDRTLLVITFDEHGGTYDHVLPPTGAATPDSVSNPGDEGFPFNRFGVRVPTIVVSPYVEQGTVFRSNAATPYDHTAILATLRDALDIPASNMLPSKRIIAAPNLLQVLSRETPRSDIPAITPPSAPALRALVAPSLEAPLSDFQKGIVAAVAARHRFDVPAVMVQVQTRKDAIDFLTAVRQKVDNAQGRFR